MSEQYIYGIHAVQALLNSDKRTVTGLFVQAEREDKRIQAILQLAEAQKISVHKLSAKAMSERFEDLKHQGIVALSSAPIIYQEKDIPALLKQAQQPPLILILDGVTDPHNLGACLRSADAAAVDFVVIPKDKSAQYSPLVSKVACGAAETVPLAAVTNLVRAIELLKEHQVWIYGAAGEASSALYDMDCRGAMAIVMGAEGTGLRRLTRERCDGLFSIPMKGTVNSLNVSVATGICLFEVLRQRQGI